MTDLCEYCEKEVLLKKKIAQILRDYKCENENDISVIKSSFHNKALVLQKQLDNSDNPNENSEQLKNNYFKLKSIIDDLRDYEVKFYVDI